MFNYPRECSTTLGDLFNYPRECSTILGDLFNYPGECSTTLGDLFNYPRDCSTTLDQGLSGRHLGGIWEASRGIWRHLEASGGIWRHPGEKVIKSIVFYNVLARDPLFRCRVAKVGHTKYRKTHGSRAQAWRERAAKGSIAPSLATP